MAIAPERSGCKRRQRPGPDLGRWSVVQPQFHERDIVPAAEFLPDLAQKGRSDESRPRMQPDRNIVFRGDDRDHHMLADRAGMRDQIAQKARRQPLSTRAAGAT